MSRHVSNHHQRPVKHGGPFWHQPGPFSTRIPLERVAAQAKAQTTTQPQTPQSAQPTIPTAPKTSIVTLPSGAVVEKDSNGNTVRIITEAPVTSQTQSPLVSQTQSPPVPAVQTPAVNITPLSITRLVFENSISDIYVRANKTLKGDTVEMFIGKWTPISQLQTWNDCRQVVGKENECIAFKTTQTVLIPLTQTFNMLDGDINVYQYKLANSPSSYADYPDRFFFKLKLTAIDGTTYTTRDFHQDPSQWPQEVGIDTKFTP